VPRYHWECAKHGIFEMVLPVSEWSDPKPCPKRKCGRASAQVLLPQREVGILPRAIVVHRDKEGNYRFPGSDTARIPKGFERVELKTIKEVEKFEREVSVNQNREASMHRENEERFFAPMRSKSRSELREHMNGISALGRDFARFAIAMNNARKKRTGDTNFHVEILHQDASNREAHRDESTGWKRKYY
jgi:hypothetical protein